MTNTALMKTLIAAYPCRRGKVRDIYDLRDKLLIVATDRLSAFDVVMPNGVPDKGRVLTQISLFWFEKLSAVMPNHLLSSAPADLPADIRDPELDGRFMLCRKADVVPIECIVRGYLAGSGWKEYQKSGAVCGIKLPAGLRQCDQLPEPIFTPSTKADAGHDENITFEAGCKLTDKKTMSLLRDKSIEMYLRGREHAAGRGIIIADTKFEFGRDDSGKVILIDEALTPDSSRFWPMDRYKPGRDQPSFDKQFVRDWLDEIGFDRQDPGPMLPVEIIQRTREKYIEAYTKLTGRKFPWE